jgi:hypothetical protein
MPGQFSVTINTGQVLEFGIDEPVAFQLAVDRGAVAAETFCNFQNRHLGVMPAGNLAAVFEAEMDV